jgi:hypothetical protein
LHGSGRVTPEPGVVDIRVEMAQRDERRVGLQEVLDRALMAKEEDGIPFES